MYYRIWQGEMLYVDFTLKLEINQGVMVDGHHPYDGHHPLTTFTTIHEFGSQKILNGHELGSQISLLDGYLV